MDGISDSSARLARSRAHEQGRRGPVAVLTVTFVAPVAPFVPLAWIALPGAGDRAGRASAATLDT